MGFDARNIRVVRIGSGQGVILPKALLKSYDVSVGDQVTIQIPYIDRGERRDYQERKGYTTDRKGNIIKK